MANEALRARGVTVAFGALKALEGVDFELRQGEILGLIGPNGAGKTTFTNVLSGYQAPTDGAVLVDDEPVTGWSADKLARHGVARTFQSVRPFASLSVFENIEAAASGVGLTRKTRRTLASDLVEQLGLTARIDLPAKDLPHGEQRRLGIARALATSPRYLLLDEPAAGLNEEEGDYLVAALSQIRSNFKCGLMVIEHDMRVIMQLCDRIHVLDHGKTIALGTPAQVRSDPTVITAYLGSARETV